jgi:hypothetical protein
MRESNFLSQFSLWGRPRCGDYESLNSLIVKAHGIIATELRYLRGAAAEGPIFDGSIPFFKDGLGTMYERNEEVRLATDAFFSSGGSR